MYITHEAKKALPGLELTVSIQTRGTEYDIADVRNAIDKLVNELMVSMGDED